MSEGHFMGPRGMQGQMLYGVHLPASLRASKQSLCSVINIIDVAIPMSCQKKGFEGILWTSNNDEVTAEPVCAVQDYQTCFSVHSIQKTDNCVWVAWITELSTTAPNSLCTDQSYRL